MFWFYSDDMNFYEIFIFISVYTISNRINVSIVFWIIGKNRVKIVIGEYSGTNANANAP